MAVCIVNVGVGRGGLGYRLLFIDRKTEVAAQ